MARLIDADKFGMYLADVQLANRGWRDDVCELLDDVMYALEEEPTIDAVEVVHARWVVKGQDVFCSHCDKESGYNPWGASAFSDYCPNCGAKMDGEENYD